MAETEVKSINGRALCDDQARNDINKVKQDIKGMVFEETDPTVPAWAKQQTKPTYTAEEVGARPDTWTPSAEDVGVDPAGTAESKVSDHNTSIAAHNDIRLLIEGLTTRLNALANSDDTTLDQMAEVVAYIKANRTLIESVTTDKVNVADIINNLTTNVANKPLSAAQGVVLKNLIDTLQTAVNAIKVPTKTSELTNDSKYVTDTELTAKGYAKQSEVDGLSDEIVDLTLGLHTDGLVYLFDKNGQPQGTGIAMVGGETGDVIGNVDSANNIVLNGNLPLGEYTVKYEMEDGSLTNIGTLTVVSGDTPTSRLPSEYQEVEWVQIVNAERVEITSCVHTGIKWSEANKIVTKVQNINSTNENDIFFAGWSSGTTKVTPYIATRTSKANYMLGAQSGLTTYSVSPNNIAPTDLNANEYTLNFTVSTAVDICFGSWYDNGYSHPHKWYYVEIYNGDTLLGNFIPCYRKADNVNGFYDLVGGAFYADSGVSTTGSAFTFQNRGNNV